MPRQWHIWLYIIILRYDKVETHKPYCSPDLYSCTNFKYDISSLKRTRLSQRFIDTCFDASESESSLGTRNILFTFVVTMILFVITVHLCSTPSSRISSSAHSIFFFLLAASTPKIFSGQNFVSLSKKAALTVNINHRLCVLLSDVLQYAFSNDSFPDPSLKILVFLSFRMASTIPVPIEIRQMAEKTF